MFVVLVQGKRLDAFLGSTPLVILDMVLDAFCMLGLPAVAQGVKEDSYAPASIVRMYEHAVGADNDRAAAMESLGIVARRLLRTAIAKHDLPMVRRVWPAVDPAFLAEALGAALHAYALPIQEYLWLHPGSTFSRAELASLWRRILDLHRPATAVHLSVLGCVHTRFFPLGQLLFLFQASSTRLVLLRCMDTFDPELVDPLDTALILEALERPDCT